MPCRNFPRGRRDAAPRFFQEAGVMPRRDFSKGVAWCRAAFFQEAGAIPWLPCCNFSRGRRNTTIAAPQFLFGRRDTTIAVPQFLLAGAILRLPRHKFYWPAWYYNCRAAIFEVASVILRLPRRDYFFWPAPSVDCRAAIFSFGQRDRTIAAPQFFQSAGAIPKLPFDCCFLVLRPFATIRRNPQASHQPFGAILIAPTIWRDTQPCSGHSLIQNIALPSGAKLKHLAPIGH
jgi:hypothetical protein